MPTTTTGHSHARHPGHVAPGRIAVVGDGRVGRALVAALTAAGADVDGPLGRGATAPGADVVLLAVPDQAIAQAAGLIPPGPAVGHLSGATTLEPLRGHHAFSLHPLMTVTDATARFGGVPAAIAGRDAAALETARSLAHLLGLAPFVVEDADRTAYHAAATLASNYLVALEHLAERLAASAGVGRDALVPLVTATVDNWARLGARAALTGPVVRGDRATVAAQRAAVEQRLPEGIAVFDALTEVTRALAGGARTEHESGGR